MSEEDFLSRWSRRKSEAAEETQSPKPSAEAVSPDPAGTSSAPLDKPADSAKPSQGEEFDLASLPPIDSITAATDVTAFLRRGVPLELTRAALRRAWATDPTIRDFVGLAENAWDFNDPNAMPGFGALDHTPEQIRQLVSKIVGEVRREAEGITSAIADNAADGAPRGEGEPAVARSPESSLLPAADTVTPPGATETGGTEDQERTQNGNAAAQNEQPDSRKTVRRAHGGALPR